MAASLAAAQGWGRGLSLMARCAANTEDGRPCERIVKAAQRYCYSHDPGRAAERRRNASKAARSRPSRDLANVKAQLQEMADEVLAGERDRAVAAVAGQLLNIKLRAIEVERKVKETDELAERIEALERTSEAGGGRAKPWGA
jgi:hypothetical protein